jgi:dipeptidyl aminopeptidase/acylaminoacyl peptidase
MRKTALLLIGLAFASMPAGAYAKEKKEKAISPETVFYGDGSSEYAVLYRGGPAPSVHPTVLLLHENGASTKSVNPYALSLQSEGFTVLALEWGKIAEKYGARIWEPLTNEIKSAIAYFQEPVRAAELGVIPDRIAMVGGSRGANLSLLTSLKANLAVPGTIKPSPRCRAIRTSAPRSNATCCCSKKNRPRPTGRP